MEGELADQSLVMRCFARGAFRCSWLLPEPTSPQQSAAKVDQVNEALGNSFLGRESTSWSCNYARDVWFLISMKGDCRCLRSFLMGAKWGYNWGKDRDVDLLTRQLKHPLSQE